jgi:hypothetical protein
MICRILIKFCICLLLRELLSKLEFCENHFRKNHYFLKGVYEFLPLLSVFLELYEGRLGDLYTAPLRHL